MVSVHEKKARYAGFIEPRAVLGGSDDANVNLALTHAYRFAALSAAHCGEEKRHTHTGREGEMEHIKGGLLKNILFFSTNTLLRWY